MQRKWRHREANEPVMPLGPLLDRGYLTPKPLCVLRCSREGQREAGRWRPRRRVIERCRKRLGDHRDEEGTKKLQRGRKRKGEIWSRSPQSSLSPQGKGTHRCCPTPSGLCPLPHSAQAPRLLADNCTCAVTPTSGLPGMLFPWVSAWLSLSHCLCLHVCVEGAAQRIFS